MLFDHRYDFALTAKLLAAAKGHAVQAAMMAESIDARHRVVEILKAAVSAGGTGAGWGGSLADYQSMVAVFVESLRSDSVFGRLLADDALVRVPLRTNVTAVTSAIGAATVAEGAPAPMSRMTLAAGALDGRRPLRRRAFSRWRGCRVERRHMDGSRIMSGQTDDYNADVFDPDGSLREGVAVVVREIIDEARSSWEAELKAFLVEKRALVAELKVAILEARLGKLEGDPATTLPALDQKAIATKADEARATGKAAARKGSKP